MVVGPQKCFDIFFHLLAENHVHSITNLVARGLFGVGKKRGKVFVDRVILSIPTGA